MYSVPKLTCDIVRLQPLTDVFTKCLEAESIHRSSIVSHLQNESNMRNDMIQLMKNDLEFRKQQSRISNKSDQLLSLIAAGIPFAQAQKYVSEQFKN